MNNEQSNIDQTMAKKSGPRILIRIATWMTYPFLALSCLVLFGLSFGMIFITEFSIENRTDELLLVTPVGTVGKQGLRRPLPILLKVPLPIRAAKSGGFVIASTETTTLWYDMDDINFSEIVVQNSEGQQRQIVVNPKPTERQYHAPKQRHYVIDNFEKLSEVPVNIREAATAAQVPINYPYIILTLIIVPWFVYFGLAWLGGKFQSTEKITDAPSSGE